MRNNKLKIVIDTNIFVNGIIFHEKYTKITNLLKIIGESITKDTIELVFSQDTIGELMYVMKNFAKHYISNEEDQKQILYMISDIIFDSYCVNTKHTKLKVECLDPTDNMFLKCAVQSKANYIISNDIKSGLHKIKDKFKVVTADELVKLFEDK